MRDRDSIPKIVPFDCGYNRPALVDSTSVGDARGSPQSEMGNALRPDRLITIVRSLYKSASVGERVPHERPPQFHLDFGQQPAIYQVFMWIVPVGGPKNGECPAVPVHDR